MAATLVQSAEGTSTLATVTASFPSTPTNGNLIVLRFAADDYNGTPNTGWTQSTGMEQQTYHGGYLWWKIASGGSNSFQYTIGSATNSSWTLEEWSGLEASPYDTSNGQSAVSSSGSYTTPSITPSAGDRLLLAALGSSNSSGDMSADLTGWTNSFTGSICSGPVSASGTRDNIGGAYRTVTANGSTSYSTGASFPFTKQSHSGMIIAFKVASGGGGQSITGSLFTNTNSFYGATVGRGAVNISGALYSDADTFFASTLNKTYAISGSRFDNAAQFYAATVTPGTVSISGALFTDGDTFYAATVGRGVVDISGALYTDPDSFYAATVSQAGSPQNIDGALFSNANALYGATVSSSYTVSGALYSDADAFYAATIAASYAIGGALYTDPDTFFAASISQPNTPQTITGQLYANDNQFFGGVVGGGARNRGDDAPRRRPFVFEEQSQDEPEPAKRTVKRKVTLNRIEKAIELPDPGIPASWIPEPAQAKAFLPAQIAIPSFEAGDEQAIIAAIRDMIVQQAIEQDEEDIEMLLMVA